MKKVIMLALCVLAVLGMTACGKDKEKTLKIGLNP